MFYGRGYKWINIAILRRDIKVYYNFWFKGHYNAGRARK